MWWLAIGLLIVDMVLLQLPYLIVQDNICRVWYLRYYKVLQLKLKCQKNPWFIGQSSELWTLTMWMRDDIKSWILELYNIKVLNPVELLQRKRVKVFLFFASRFQMMNLASSNCDGVWCWTRFIYYINIGFLRCCGVMWC